MLEGRGSAHAARLTFVALFAALATAALAACDEDSPAAGDDGTLAEALNITVTGDGLRPRQIDLFYPSDVEVSVTNEADEACAFFIGAYLRDLDVPAGEARTLAVSIFETEELPADNTVAFGCAENEALQGTARVESSFAPDAPAGELEGQDGED